MTSPHVLQASILFSPISLMFHPRSIPLLPLFLFFPFIIYFFPTAATTTRGHQASCQLGQRWSAYHLTAILAAAINITDANTGFPVASVLIPCYTSGALPVAVTVLLCMGFVPRVLGETFAFRRSALVIVERKWQSGKEWVRSPAVPSTRSKCSSDIGFFNVYWEVLWLLHGGWRLCLFCSKSSWLWLAAKLRLEQL